MRIMFMNTASVKEKVRSLNQTITVSSKLMGLFWQMDKVLFIENLLAVIIPAIIPFVSAYIFKLIIDFVVGSLTGKSTNINHIYLLLVILFGVQFINRLAFTVQDYVIKIFYIKFPAVIDDLVLTKVSNLDLYYFEDSSFRDLLQKPVMDITFILSSWFISYYFLFKAWFKSLFLWWRSGNLTIFW